MAALPASFPAAESSFVRRLVEAKDDRAKKRIRAWLMDLDDLQLSGLGLTPVDIGRGHLKVCALEHANSPDPIDGLLVV
jgi:hypothetical protein